ncbi:MAG: hypothetical protein JJV98_07835 [Desulfosarcina sp.]|nr:hypothetical protein [Desulfobacterales bacterium]
MYADERKAALDDELIMIRNSGEIPEVALHNAVYFLSQDPEGPSLKLLPKEIRRLQEAVMERYRRIVLRDLDSRLRDKTVYRGVERCITNWERLCRFAAREGFPMQSLRQEIVVALTGFIQQEVADVRSGPRETCINCSPERLQRFSAALGVDPEDLPPGWTRLRPRKMTGTPASD